MLDGSPPCLPLPHTRSTVKLLAANSWQKMDIMLLHIPQRQVAALKEIAAGEPGRGWQAGRAAVVGWAAITAAAIEGNNGGSKLGS